jgi:hypothetical protein
MTDGPMSDQIRQRALRHIDPRGRPSLPGPSSLELAVEEAAMRLSETERPTPSGSASEAGLVGRNDTLRASVSESLEVEGYERKASDAGIMEAAGIEPAFHDLRNNNNSNGFEHWKLDGAGEGGGVVPHELEGNNRPPALESSSPSNFSAKTTICGIDFEVHREGKHVNLHLYSDEENLERLWTFEPVETAIPKLEAILGAARLAANSE